MGMSASQMRYCMLTGRKSNIEFQGQQINQQRTTLATQSSAINEQMLTMSVPTPPSSDEYVKTVYKFDMDGQECQLTGKVVYNTKDNETTGSNAGTWDVEYTTSKTTSKGQKAGEAYYTLSAGNYFTSNGQKLTKLGDMDKTSNDYATYSANVALIKKDCNKTTDEADNYYYYKATDGTVRFVAGSELANSVEKSVAAPSYYVNEKATVTETKNMKNCTVSYNEKNRITQIFDEDNYPYTMTIETQTDEDAYNDAYNQYEYDKYEYEQDLNEINAKLELIQAQDKQLELKLTNLDTEQNAISTEMDAVKKVIDKNVESTFKTFG